MSPQAKPLSLQLKAVFFEAEDQRFRLVPSDGTPTFRLTIQGLVAILASAGEENQALVQEALTQAYQRRAERLSAVAAGKTPINLTPPFFEPEGPYFRETVYRWVFSHDYSYKGPSRIMLEPWLGGLYELVPPDELQSIEDLEDMRALQSTVIEIPKGYRQTIDPDTFKPRWMRPVNPVP